jgi:hypothetical protein
MFNELNSVNQLQRTSRIEIEVKELSTQGSSRRQINKRDASLVVSDGDGSD